MGQIFRNLSLVAVLLVGLLVVSEGQGKDAGAPVNDASTQDVALDSVTEAVSDVLEVPDAGPTLRQRAERLRSILSNLEQVLEGKTPSEGYIEDLFPFDLRDDKTVEVARKDLKAAIAALEEKRKALREEVDVGGLDADLEAGPDAKPVDAGPMEPVDAGVLDAEAGTDASVGEEEEVNTKDKVLELELAVAKARLTFLNWPLERRQSVLDKEGERRRAELEKERASEEREKALAEQKRAEAARQRALADAERARNEQQRVIANELARMEGARGAQAVYQRELAERRQSWAVVSAGQLERNIALNERVRAVRPGLPEADALYDDVVHELSALRVLVRNGLEAYRHVPVPVRYHPDESYEAIRSKLAAKERAEVERNVRELTDSAIELESQARKLAWDSLVALVTREEDLNARRIELLDLVSPQKRSAVLGFGMEGIAQLQRELERVVLEARWYHVHGEVRIRSLRELIKSPLWVGRITWSVLMLAGVVALVLYGRRKGPAALERLRVLVVRSVRRPSYARPLAAMLDALVAVLPALLFVLGVLGAQRALGDAAKLMEFAVPLRLLLWYASYRLLIVASHRLLYRAISREEGEKTGKRSDRMVRSVRLVARYGFAVAIMLIVAADVLGKGYLYHLVLRFAWLGALPIFALLVRWWRDDIVDAYLDHRSKGRLADLVRSTRKRWFGFFVAVAAFAVVLGQASLRALRRFVLGFEQTRKALAFLFRRRLERRAAESSEVPSELQLPEDLRRWFSEEPVNDETFAVTELPGLGIFEKETEHWVKGEKSAAILVVGDTGFGKTSWLNTAALQIPDAPDAPVDRLVFGTRMLAEAELLAFLVRGLKLEVPDSPSRSDVIDAISRGKRRIVMLDDIHHLTLRGVETLEAWDALSDVVERTRFNTLWVAAMGAFAQQHLAWVRGGVEPFRWVVRLGPWEEGRIALLIQSRTRESEYHAVYDDLVVDKLEGVEGEAQLVSTQEGYTRLIWDYADGCPRVALHCWKNSLVPDGDKRVRVRLFRRPDTNELESLSETEKFVLAATVWHTTLSLNEAASSLNVSEAICLDALDKLHDSGILDVQDERYRVTTRWLCPVVRYLKRKHLIEE